MRHEPLANRQAILLMVLSMSALASNDSIMRYIGASVPVGQMMVIRGVVLCTVLVVGCLLAKQALQVKDILHRWCVLRGCAELFGTYMFLTSLSLLPIAVASTLVFSSPIILTALSGPMFGERVGPWRWGAVIAGFCGILLITAPGTELWQPAMALPIGAAIMVVLRDVCTRYVADHVSSGAVTLTTAIAVTLGGLFSLFWGWVPVTMVQVGWLSLAAIIIGASFFSYI
ncbi:MAG: DMT family transporter, partial [Fimbriimonadaceae bacterium]|nr:DMT family transporter [Alphaproteobacteria bacterium]